MTSNIATFISLPQVHDARGNLTFAECGNHIPFDIRRIYFLSEGVAGHPRGGHAHKKTQQVLIPIVGKTLLALDNGKKREEVILDKPTQGLLMRPKTFLDNIRLDPGAVCLVLSSALYDEADYIRSYPEFLKML